MNRKGMEATGTRLFEMKSNMYHVASRKNGRLYMCDCAREAKVPQNYGMRRTVNEFKRDYHGNLEF